MFAAALGTVYGRMKRVKDALRRFWTRARGLAGRGRAVSPDADAGETETGARRGRNLPETAFFRD